MYTRLLKHRGKEVQHFGYEFNTFTFRSFNWLHEMFYYKGKKVINPKIEEFITPLSLAIWILSQPLNYEELKLYAGLLREGDINKLILILKNRYGFICYSIKDKNSFYGIGIANESKYLFRSIVQPCLDSVEKSIYVEEEVKSRTSVSLNANFKAKPGNELVRGNISKGLINWKKSGNIILVTNIVTKETVSYNLVSEAARALNLNRFIISRRIKDEKILNNLYKFSFL